MNFILLFIINKVLYKYLWSCCEILYCIGSWNFKKTRHQSSGLSHVVSFILVNIFGGTSQIQFLCFGHNNNLVIRGTFQKWIKCMPFSFLFFCGWMSQMHALLNVLFGNLSPFSTSSTICFFRTTCEWISALNSRRNFHDSQEGYGEEQIEGERFNHTRATIHAIYVKNSFNINNSSFGNMIFLQETNVVSYTQGIVS